ncbi:MAG: EAL domain-containing protein [Halanaerobiaceae bacterium]
MKSNREDIDFKKVHSFFFHHIPLPTLQLDRAGNIIDTNRAMEKLTQFTAKELKNTTVEKLVRKKDKAVLHHTISKTGQDSEKTSFNTVILNKNGQQVPASVTLFSRLERSRDLIYFTAIDISRQKKAEKRVHFLKNYDPLTGLPNRKHFAKKFQSHLKNSNREKGEISSALLFIDLDHFKKINNSFGRRVGDRVLQQASLRLRKCVQEEDFISRSGGDEFFIFLTCVESREQVRAVAEKIIEEFSRPYQITDHHFYVTPSIGISLYPANGNTLKELSNNASRALNRVKLRGKNHYLFYRAENTRKVSRKIYLENEMRQALAEDKFQLYYQPQINLSTLEIVGMEALIRWEHPEMGFISPRKFIPIAEETGLIIPIGEWVLNKACRQSIKWHKSFNNPEPIKTAINISIRQFQQGNITQTVEKILSENRIKPQMLELEITENIMRNIKKLTLELKKLKDLGVKLSIDDFGTGYSSLNILNNLPLDTLKIDQSFVRGISRDQTTASLVKTIINMGANLDFDIIAEGVEKKTQATFLQLNRCQTGQGYYFSRPLPPELLEKKIDVKNKKLYEDYYH